MAKNTIPYVPAAVGIRTDGSRETGFGHITRQLTLARTLKDRFGWLPTFLTATQDSLRSLFRAADEFPVIALAADAHDGEAEAEAAKTHQLGLLLCDLQRPLSREYVLKVREGGCKVWLYGNSGPGTLAADNNVFAFPQVARHLLEDYEAIPALPERDYAIMDEVFGTLRQWPPPSRKGSEQRLFVSMGGADNAFLTGLVTEALAHVGTPLHADIVTGPGFAHGRELADLLERLKCSWRVHHAPEHFAYLAAASDLAITQMGNTVAELNCIGTPALLLNSTEFHHKVAELYCAEGAARNLGLSTALPPEALAREINELLENGAACDALRRQGMATIDGRGAIRLADALFDSLQQDFSRHHCDVCGNDSFTPQAVLNGRPLVRCRTCGLEYMNLRPSPQRLAQVYAAEYFTAPRTQSAKTSYEQDKPNVLRFARARLDTLEKRLPDKGRLLDVGCALGFYLEEAASRGWQVTGMDISDYAIDFARSNLGITDVHKGTIETMDFAPQSFDAIICSLVFEHFLDPRACLVKMASWLRPGGYLAIKVPHGNGLMRRYTPQDWFDTHPDNHFCDYTPETLGRLLLSEGLWPEEWLTEGIYVERLAGAMRLDEPQTKAFLAVDCIADKWRDLAAAHLLGDSLVLFGRKL